MTSVERFGQQSRTLRPPPELVFWAVMAIVVSMTLCGLIVGVAIGDARFDQSDADEVSQTALAIVILSAPIVLPTAMFYMSVFCRVRMAALGMSACLAVVSVGAFFGMLAATFFSEVATAVLLVILAVSLRAGHLNTLWYQELEHDNAPRPDRYRLLDLGLSVVSLAIVSAVAAWTWTW